MKIPFLDLAAQHREIAGEIAAAVHTVIASGSFILGVELEAFEEEFARYCGVRHCVGVANGLEALELLLRAHGIGSGDEVLVPSSTFIATWLAVTRTGARPVPVDICAGTGNLDAGCIPAAITPRTRALIAVHLYGQVADMDAIHAQAKAFGLVVLEDAAQAQGARYRGRRAGSLAQGAATSFYPTKNLGALGDAGAVLTDDEHLAATVRRLRNYGSVRKYHHEVLGGNSRLDEIQAAVLRVKLRHLDGWNERRRRLAGQYLRSLAGGRALLPVVPSWSDPVWHLFVIRHPQRDALQAYLEACGIGTMVHYPVPPHRQPCYLADHDGVWLPQAQAHAAQVLSLPMCPTLGAAVVDAVAHALRAFDAREPPAAVDRAREAGASWHA